MAIHIEERFRVNAPVQAVWDYLVDPRRVVLCLPGAELTEVVDERTFHGNVKVKVGTVTVSYKGRVRIVDIDVAGHRARMEGDGRESTGAGSAKMAMESTVTPAEGGTEVVVRADVDVVGRIVQLGRGMIEQVSHQLFQQFAACVRSTLEGEEAARLGATAPAPPPRRPEAVAALPLLMRALWAWFVGLFRRRPRSARRP
ncbi:MAG TPA: SRPBCC family protein [Anaeromyxobacter sp.]